MKTAVAILNWNGEKLLEEFLPSVVEYSQNADIYVIDNASDDDSISFIKQNFPSVKIIKNKANFGYAKGYNEGIKKIQNQENYELFCLLNSDVEVSKNWLIPIQQLFKENNEIAIAQPKILDYKQPTHFEYAGAGGGFIDNYGYPYCRGRIFWTLEEDTGQYDDTVQTFWASGACFFIRTSDFTSSGGFDERFFAHMEEIDLCWRINNLGKKVYYCGTSTVYHLGGGTLKNSNPKKTFLNFRNSLWMLVKHLPKGNIFPLIFTRLSLDGVTGIVFLFYEGFPHLWAIVKSHFSFYRKLHYYSKQRKPGMKKYYSKKFIPFQYFIKKRKYFSDLK
ncbi:MAG: glycosyltransferase family 2 protein [Moheibacter sp.]